VVALAVSTVMTAVVGVSALGMAILAAIVPGWRAARMRVAPVLRAE
jgi:ABC-type lipoprotein release transport system permease subunit